MSMFVSDLIADAIMVAKTGNFQTKLCLPMNTMVPLERQSAILHYKRYVTAQVNRLSDSCSYWLQVVTCGHKFPGEDVL